MRHHPYMTIQLAQKRSPAGSTSREQAVNKLWFPVALVETVGEFVKITLKVISAFEMTI